MCKDDPFLGHKDLIQAALNGQTIQYRLQSSGERWVDYADAAFAIRDMCSPSSPVDAFRVKPEEKVTYSNLYSNEYPSIEAAKKVAQGWGAVGQIKITRINGVVVKREIVENE